MAARGACRLSLSHLRVGLTYCKKKEYTHVPFFFLTTNSTYRVPEHVRCSGVRTTLCVWPLEPECVSTPASFVHSDTLYISMVLVHWIHTSVLRRILINCLPSPSGRSARNTPSAAEALPAQMRQSGDNGQGGLGERQADRRPPASSGRRLHAQLFLPTRAPCPRVANFLGFLAASALDLAGRSRARCTPHGTGASLIRCPG